MTKSKATGQTDAEEDTTEYLYLWQPFYLDNGQIAGFNTLLNNTFAFTTIRAAGHEVPAYQPQSAYLMLASFINGSLFHLHEIVDNQHSSKSETKIYQEMRMDGWLLTLAVVVSTLAAIAAALILFLFWRHQSNGQKFPTSEQEEKTAAGDALSRTFGGSNGIDSTQFVAVPLDVSEHNIQEQTIENL